LKELKEQVEALGKLEEAVYDARGADDDVIDSVLKTSTEGAEGGSLRRSNVMRTVQVYMRSHLFELELMRSVSTRAIEVDGRRTSDRWLQAGYLGGRDVQQHSELDCIAQCHIAATTKYVPQEFRLYGSR
jgi:hypothetical protein